MIEIYFAPHMLAGEKAIFSIAPVFHISQNEQNKYFCKKNRAPIMLTKARFCIIKNFCILVEWVPEQLR